ncbi:hypothetical protein WJ32_08410 [Burkholderia ubonensis]|uniref:Uncharacterized protein n=1 Tax=Burkholderia ubonensis TaxID=101571 RepID=A0A103QVN8_9BURK|nr:hypothetical protein WJ32_08410 [Burkholderia ubonensis]KVG56440.1 hypothetical protein WJ33_37075 [Burkholderia ubonensis]
MGLSRCRRQIHIHWDRATREWRVRSETASIILGYVVIEWGFPTCELAFAHARKVWEIVKR